MWSSKHRTKNWIDCKSYKWLALLFFESNFVILAQRMCVHFNEVFFGNKTESYVACDIHIGCKRRFCLIISNAVVFNSLGCSQMTQHVSLWVNRTLAKFLFTFKIEKDSMKSADNRNSNSSIKVECTASNTDFHSQLIRGMHFGGNANDWHCLLDCYGMNQSIRSDIDAFKSNYDIKSICC